MTIALSPTTLSCYLRKLEEALDVRLFEPRGRRLSPTAAAHVLLQAADEVTCALERCERSLGDVRSRAAAAPAGVGAAPPRCAA